MADLVTVAAWGVFVFQADAGDVDVDDLVQTWIWFYAADDDSGGLFGGAGVVLPDLAWGEGGHGVSRWRELMSCGLRLNNGTRPTRPVFPILRN